MSKHLRQLHRPVVCAAATSAAPTQLLGPVHEYIRLMRSYLSDVQRVFVREQVEAEALRHRGDVPIRFYVDLLQSLLSPAHKQETATFLESLCEEHGWIVSRG